MGAANTSANGLRAYPYPVTEWAARLPIGLWCTVGAFAFLSTPGLWAQSALIMGSLGVSAIPLIMSSLLIALFVLYALSNKRVSEVWKKPPNVKDGLTQCVLWAIEMIWDVGVASYLVLSFVRAVVQILSAFQLSHMDKIHTALATQWPLLTNLFLISVLIWTMGYIAYTGYNPFCMICMSTGQRLGDSSNDGHAHPVLSEAIRRVQVSSSVASREAAALRKLPSAPFSQMSYNQ